jgi:hypothetical protein
VRDAHSLLPRAPVACNATGRGGLLKAVPWRRQQARQETVQGYYL